MENRLTKLWLGLLVLTATFSRSAQLAICSRSNGLLLCFGSGRDDIVDLRDYPGIGDRSTVERISITGSQVGSFTNEVLLSYPMLRTMNLTRNEISPEFFPVGVFKNVKITELSILDNNVEYNNHFAKVINDLEFLTFLDLTDNPIRNFDPAAIEVFDRINTLIFNPENIVCDCDLSWFRNYLLNYEGTLRFPDIICASGRKITESNFCSASDQMMLVCRICTKASSNEECNDDMGNKTCGTTDMSGTHPVCLNEITYAGGEKRITKSCASSSRCRGARAINENNCYSDNPTRCVYCCRGELCNDFETAVLENYFPANYPFRPTTPVPTTTLPTTTYKPTTSKFTTTPFMTSLVPTTQAPSTIATTSPTTTERTTIPTTSETTKIITTFPPTTETTTSPTTTIQTTIPATTPKFTTMEPTTTTVTTMQPTTTTVATTQPTPTTFTTTQPTTTTITTMQPATTTQPTTTTITTMQPATTTQPTTTTITTMQPATTTQPTTTTITTMQPTSAVTTVQPTTTTVTTMPPTTTTITTVQPTTTTVTTMQPPTTTVTTMQPPTTTVTTMQPPTTMQRTTKTTSTMKAKTSKVITTQPLTTTASTTQPETTKVTTKEPKTTTNPLTTSRKSTASSTTQRTTVIFTEEGNLTTPDLTTSLPNIIETTTAKITTISPTTMVYLCPPEEQNGKYGDLQWPGTKVGSVAIIECPFNLGGFTANATRMCVLRGQSAVWKDPDLSSCSSNSDVLEKLAHENVTTENIVEIAEELAEVTDESDTLEESDVQNAVTVIESVSKVVNDAKDDTDRVLDDIIETVNHLSQVQDEQLTKAQRAGNTSSRIIQAVESTLMSIEIQDSDYDSKSEALDVRIIKLNNEREAENIRFPKFDAKKEDDNEMSNNTVDVSSRTHIEIPKSVIGDARRVQFILYKDTSLFEAILKADEATTQRSECAEDEPCVIERQALRSFVISASIENRTVTNLDTPIVNVFTHLTDDDKEYANNSQCVFWDFAAAGGRGDWSTEGCSVNSSESGVTVCHCTHLTNFALLLDIYGNVGEISETHQRIITYISIGGVALSFFCLVLALVSYSCAPRLRADKRVKVLLNLMVALMLMNLAFLFDSMVSTFAFNSKYLCFGAAIAMHYTLLCVMTWMAIEAFTMYLALVRVFDSKQRHFILKVFFLGWGLPAVIVGASVGVDRENYGFYNNLCYLDRISFFICFFVPACIVLIWNSTVYVLVSRQMCRLRKRQTEFSQTFSLSDQLRASFSLTFLLGLTWLFGFFSFGDLNLTFTYLFAITNALQGFIVFLFHCVFKKEIRRQWHALCCPCISLLKDGDDGTGTYSRSRSGTNGANEFRPSALLSNRREYNPVNMPSGRSTRSRSWFWQPDHRRRSVAESTTTDMTRLSAVGSEIGGPTSTVGIRSSQGGRNSHTTSFAMSYTFEHTMKQTMSLLEVAPVKDELDRE